MSTSSSHPSPRPAAIPFGELRYRLTPSLARALAWAARQGGALSAMHLSHFGLKRLQAEATGRRVLHMATGAGARTSPEEVSHVIAGAVLPPRRHAAQQKIREAVVLREAVRHYAERGERSSPRMFTAYRSLASAVGAGATGPTLWSRFVGSNRGRLLDQQRDDATIDDRVRRLYEWLDADELLTDQGLLRAAVLHWGLTLLFPYPADLPSIEAVVDHELRADGLDRHGLLVMHDSQQGAEALRLSPLIIQRADLIGELTDLLEHVAFHGGLALSELVRRLQAFQDREDRLPWLMPRPPDDLDRRVFDAIARAGSLTSAAILATLPEPRPPIRTLQRRLQRLALDGLLAKHGARKDAFYTIADRF